MAVRVSIYEDNELLRESLCVLVSGMTGFTLAGSHINCSDVEENILNEYPDVVVMDIEMPGTNGIEGVKRLKKYSPATEVIMLTVFDDDTNIFQCLSNGASGYILKGTQPAKILDAIQEVHNGGSPMSAAIARRVVQQFKHPASSAGATGMELTIREKELLALLSKGNSYKMIAKEMNISVHTVQQHIKHIYSKMHVHNMGEAVAKALQHKII